MKLSSLCSLLSLSCLLSPSLIQAATLPASEDSHGFRAKLTLAANKATTLPVNAARTAFIYFNLVDLPAGAIIRYARVRLYLPKVTNQGLGIALHLVTGSWEESIASAQPAFSPTVLALIPASEIGDKRFVSVDITSTVQNWLTTPSSNKGLAITAVAGASQKLTTNLILGAKEGSGSGYPAELEVELADSPVAASSITSTELAAGAVQSNNLAPNLTLSGSTNGTFSGNGAGLTNVNALTAQSALTVSDGAITLEKLDPVLAATVGSVPIGATIAVATGTTVPAGYEDSGVRTASWKVEQTLNSANSNGNYTSRLLISGNRLFLAGDGMLEEFDYQANDWNSAAFQVGLAGSAAAVDDAGLIYFFGGYLNIAPDYRQSPRLKSVYCYNPTSGTTTQLSDMPTDYQISNILFLNGNFYFIKNSCFSYDLATQQWATFPGPSTGASISAAVVHGGVLYAFTLDTLFRKIPGDATWAEIPFLGGDAKLVLPFRNSELLIIGASGNEYSSPVLRYNDSDRSFIPEARIQANFNSTVSGCFGSELLIFSGFGYKQVTRAPISSFRSFYIKTQ